MNQTIHLLTSPGIWDTQRAHEALNPGRTDAVKRSSERKLHDLGLLAPELQPQELQDELGRPANALVVSACLESARAKRWLPLMVQIFSPAPKVTTLQANDARGARYWTALPTDFDAATPDVQGGQIWAALQALQAHCGKPIQVLGHGSVVPWLRDTQGHGDVHVFAGLHAPLLDLSTQKAPRQTPTPHLKRLEAESIHIIREAVAEAENPAMLYSVGKDSAVMLHLARKAFYPSPPPLPLVHVDTRWKFQEMYQFRNFMAQDSGMELMVHINPEAIERNINPFDHGSALHTDITKTEGLKQVLDAQKFDMVFGGARRDEEKSRAKERIFSFRSKTHRWDPKQQRPELWNLFNTRKAQGESMRVFPLSNWTELDIWQYIYQENIPVVPLYFAKVRPVVVRNGMILMVDDDRFQLMPNERIEERLVRFRTLGCYPLTGAVESTATSVAEIILELVNATSSERQGRAIDSDASASMEKKKQEGYF